MFLILFCFLISRGCSTTTGSSPKSGWRSRNCHQHVTWFLFSPLSSLAATSALLVAEQPLSAGAYQIAILVKDSLQRACELPQTVRIEACDCDVSPTCLHTGTPGISTGEGSSVTSVTGVIQGLVPGERIEGSNVGLGPAAIGMMALGLLLLLCKSW